MQVTITALSINLTCVRNVNPMDTHRSPFQTSSIFLVNDTPHDIVGLRTDETDIEILYAIL
jgi:hypothetical protein